MKKVITVCVPTENGEELLQAVLKVLEPFEESGVTFDIETTGVTTIQIGTHISPTGIEVLKQAILNCNSRPNVIVVDAPLHIAEVREKVVDIIENKLSPFANIFNKVDVVPTFVPEVKKPHLDKPFYTTLKKRKRK